MASATLEQYREAGVELIQGSLGTPIVELVRNAQTRKELLFALRRARNSNIPHGAVRKDLDTLYDMVEADCPH